MRKRLRERVYRELARAERLIKAWSHRDLVDYDIYLNKKKMEQVFPSVRVQLKEFWNHSILGKELKFTFDNLDLDKDDHVISFSMKVPAEVDGVAYPEGAYCTKEEVTEAEIVEKRYVSKFPFSSDSKKHN